jgi:hypothetical protein
LVFSRRFAISSVVYSMSSSIDLKSPLDQGENVKKSDIRTYLPYICIVNCQKIFQNSLPEP